MNYNSADHFYKIRMDSGHGKSNDTLYLYNHTAVTCPLYFQKNTLLTCKVTTRNTDSSSFRQIQLFGLEIKQMVVIGSGNGDEALHLMVGNNYLLTTAGIGYILQNK